MKKIIILLYLLIPNIVLAETIYTEYEPYLNDQTSKITTNDLISEEEITKYVHYRETITKEDYYYKYDHPENMKLIDNDFIIENHRELLQPNEKSIKAVMVNTSTIPFINEFEIINYSGSLNFVLFNQNNELIPYNRINNIVQLSNPTNDIHIIFMNNESQIISIRIDRTYFDIKLDNSEYIEVFLTSNMIYNLSLLGIYTSYQFSTWEYFVDCSIKFKYQETLTEEIVNDDSDNYDKVITKYNYYKRDRVNFKNYLELNKQKNNLYEYITDSTIPIDTIKYYGDINYSKNGIYEITYVIGNKKITKPVYILNEQENIIDNDSCEFEYQNTFTCEPNIIYVEYPVIYEKEVVKYKQLNIINKDITSNKKNNLKEAKQSSVIILFISILIIILLKMIKKKQHK